MTVEQKTENLREKEDQINAWLKQVKFKKSLFGGVKEEDVWKKLQELHALYREAIRGERLRYDALLEQRSGTLPKKENDRG